MELTEFLLARIAEDEAAARSAAGVPWEVMEWPGGSQVLVDRAAIRDEKWRVGHLRHVASVERTHDGAHIARWDPARVLAECAAKRRIVDAYREERTRRDIYWRAEEGELNDEDRKRRQSTTARTRGLEIAVEALALPFADHPDYDPAWSPSAAAASGG